MIGEKTGMLSFDKKYANPNGSKKNKSFLHVQRIGDETVKADYNSPTSHRNLEQVKRYAGSGESSYSEKFHRIS